MLAQRCALRRRAVLAVALVMEVGGAWGVAPPPHPFPPIAPSRGVRVDTAVLEYAVDPYAELRTSAVATRVLQLAHAEGVQGDLGDLVPRMERDQGLYQRVVAGLSPDERVAIPALQRRIQVARQFEAAFMPPIKLSLSQVGGWVVVSPGPATMPLFGGSYGYINFEHRQLTTIGSVLGEVVSDTQEDITMNDVFRVPQVIRSQLEATLLKRAANTELRTDWARVASSMVSVQAEVPMGRPQRHGAQNLAWLHDVVAGQPSALRRDATGQAFLRFNYYYSRALLDELPTAVQSMLAKGQTGFLVGFELEDERGQRITYRLRQHTREQLDRGVFEAPRGYPKAGDAAKALRGGR